MCRGDTHTYDQIVRSTLVAQWAGVSETGISHKFYVIGSGFVPENPLHTVAIPVDGKMKENKINSIMCLILKHLLSKKNSVQYNITAQHIQHIWKFHNTFHRKFHSCGCSIFSTSGEGFCWQNWNGGDDRVWSILQVWGRARLGVAQLRLGENRLRLKMCRLKLLPVWAFCACSANEYKF